MRTKLEVPPADDYLLERPYIHNAYIIGYRGYVEMEKLAGYTTDVTQSTKWAEYSRLLNLRLNNFSKESPYFRDDTSGSYFPIWLCITCHST